ncbi:SNF2-related protein [Uliginosibacterium paludis]|uniref:SNF2-related protein n=1 Tax=Uliginosibacterium paludis TaxID=1615952 RepID=A0ABV2CPP6_9RHOO
MNSKASARLFTREDASRWFGESTLAKAEDYVSRVSQLHISDSEISALVQGTERRPYTVRIVFNAGKRGTLVNTRCTCPAGSGCRHAAAAILLALAQRDEQKAMPDARVIAWLKDFRLLLGEAAAAQAAGSPSREQLFYLIQRDPADGRVSVAISKARLRSDGRLPENPSPWDNIERALVQPPAFLDENELVILRQLWLARDREGLYIRLRLEGRKVEDLLPRLLATGRCRFGDLQAPALQPGERRQGRLAWQKGEDGLLRAGVEAGHDLVVLPTDPPWYIDEAEALAGPLEVGLPAAQVLSLLSSPPLRPVDAALVARELAALDPALPRPGSGREAVLRELRVKPGLVLRAFTRTVDTCRPWRQYPLTGRFLLDYVQPCFDYGGLLITPDERREFHLLGTDTIRLVRDRRSEAAALEHLATLGFEALPERMFNYWSIPQEKSILGLPGESAWQGWMGHIVPALRAAGWQLRLGPDFRHHIVEPDSVFAEVSPGGTGWLKVGLGFELDGERRSLAPLLASLLESRPELLEAGALDRLPDQGSLQVQLDDGQRLRLPVERIRPLLRTFMDLFDGGDSLRVSTLDSVRLAALPPVQSGAEAVSLALERVAGLARPPAVAQPEGLGLQLRSYQLEGLAWLQQLRALDLAGILADDMGLGKTAQTLAHLLVEKQAGRLDRPALIVLPTSLVFNWQREAAHIAPALRVLALHGPARDFAAIPDHDLVLTTYPLVWRDAEQLRQHAYHLLILDEAQTVKNAASRAAGVVRQLDARHRLCLTGTPMENHLGELWAQFDFLLPGFLGNERDFARRWRTPIEKQGDLLRRDLLARRVKPFVLRRRKEDVARELPSRNVVVRSVELAGAQRELYETVRAAMDQRVREALHGRGVGRSQLLILDALLKLRQVCCDPRLLDLPGAAGIEEHAKLDILMEMLPELIEEGRRVLIFSQFVSMLSLIETALKEADIAFSKLTGQTKKREEAVARFQEGDVPVFLISLKAGGVGLNLTAADTVIHFDPWWNPAAEAQATDRAHRIGQLRPVFVYKLIVAGSIEERILSLQERKAELAAAVLSGEAQGDALFSEEDLAALLAPMPE